MAYNSFERMPFMAKSYGFGYKYSILKLTEKLPRKKDYGLTSQIRRSTLSVPGNIAEGFGRKHTKDKLNFYYDSRGSSAETKNHLIYGHRVGYFTESEFKEYTNLIEKTWKELKSLINSLQKKT